jgi:hypothetical protein
MNNRDRPTQKNKNIFANAALMSLSQTTSPKQLLQPIDDDDEYPALANLKTSFTPHTNLSDKMMDANQTGELNELQSSKLSSNNSPIYH